MTERRRIFNSYYNFEFNLYKFSDKLGPNESVEHVVKFSSNRVGVRNLIVDIDSKEQPDFQNSATIQFSNVTVVPPSIVRPRDPVVLPPPDVTDCSTDTVPPRTVPTHTVPPRVVIDGHFTASGISGKVPKQTRKVSQQSGKYCFH